MRGDFYSPALSPLHSVCRRKASPRGARATPSNFAHTLFCFEGKGRPIRRFLLVACTTSLIHEKKPPVIAVKYFFQAIGLLLLSNRSLRVQLYASFGIPHSCRMFLLRSGWFKVFNEEKSSTIILSMTVILIKQWAISGFEEGFGGRSRAGSLALDVHKASGRPYSFLIR